MIITHIVETPEEFVVSKLDCILVRFPKDSIRWPDDFVWCLEDLLKSLGENVETELL